MFYFLQDKLEYMSYSRSLMNATKLTNNRMDYNLRNYAISFCVFTACLFICTCFFTTQYFNFVKSYSLTKFLLNTNDSHVLKEATPDTPSNLEPQESHDHLPGKDGTFEANT